MRFLSTISAIALVSIALSLTFAWTSLTIPSVTSSGTEESLDNIFSNLNSSTLPSRLITLIFQIGRAHV